MESEFQNVAVKGAGWRIIDSANHVDAAAVAVGELHEVTKFDQFWHGDFRIAGFTVFKRPGSLSTLNGLGDSYACGVAGRNIMATLVRRVRDGVRWAIGQDAEDGDFAIAM
jgi:hypothetical protein